ncbi:MAG: hypothetical protein JWO86_8234 [Myxococcaceae bacterium]|nr:hypothetical protein [Myxococcaceae bacterium]
MRTHAPLAALAIFAMACNSNKNATATGAKVLEWSLAKTTRPSMKDAALSNRAKNQAQITDGATGVKLSVEIETATAKFKEDGKDVEHDAVVGVTATATSPNAFTLVDRGCSGPHYELAEPGGGHAMILNCTIKADKPRYDGVISFQLRGDGTVVPERK